VTRRAVCNATTMASRSLVEGSGTMSKPTPRAYR
jgi:hypothetical protein